MVHTRRGDDDVDVAIVGAGPVGAMLAVGLGRLGATVALIEKAAPDAAATTVGDKRHYGLSRGSRIALHGLNLWHAIAEHAVDISRIHVSYRGRFGAAVLDAADEDFATHGFGPGGGENGGEDTVSGGVALGHVVPAKAIGQALQRAVNGCDNIRLIAPAVLSAAAVKRESVRLEIKSGGRTIALRAALAIGADGADSAVGRLFAIPSHTRAYGQSAVIANLDVADAGTAFDQAPAYERFTDDGALALLPRDAGGYAMVYSTDDARARRLMTMDDAAFAAETARQFGGRFSIAHVGGRSCYPLALSRARSPIGPRLVLVGNAAHALHPLAAQGLNLSIRDAAMLLEVIGAAAGDPGAAAVLNDYARRRRRDERVMVAFTDALARFFTAPSPPFGLALCGGLAALRYWPGLRRQFARAVTGRMGAQAALMRGIPLPPPAAAPPSPPPAAAPPVAPPAASITPPTAPAPNGDYDIVIHGGGVPGLALALRLATGIAGDKPKPAILIVDKNPPRPSPAARQKPQSIDDFEPRVFAINHSSRMLFETIGLWPAAPHPRVYPYREMRVWDDGGAGRIHFHAAELGTDALGAIVEGRVLQDWLTHAIARQPSITLCADAIRGYRETAAALKITFDSGATAQTRLLVGADGANSRVRHLAGIGASNRPYGQQAITATVQTEQDHQDTAYQRFLPRSVLAFLPLQRPWCSIVWSTPTPQAKELRAMDETEFAQALTRNLDGRLGQIQSAGDRSIFPLHLSHAHRYTAPRVALIADAAHTVHPLAGQGLNLGLLDVAALARHLIAALATGRDPGDRRPLRAYERSRKGDNHLMQYSFHALQRLFANKQPLARRLRNHGLNAAHRTTPLKNALARKACGVS